MSLPPPTASPGRKSRLTRFLNLVEWLGNLLPHPVTLFAILTLAVALVSGLAEWLEWSAIDPRPDGTPGRAADGVIRPVSLLNGDGLRMMIERLVTNFTGFAPLGVVLVALLGVGVAERSGLISACIRGIVLAAAGIQPPATHRDRRPSRLRLLTHRVLAPRVVTTLAVCFAAVLSNTASEMGYVVLIPLAAVIFESMGRHPLAGLACGFACVSGGYSANLLIGTIDPLLAGITQEAANLIDPGYTVHAAVNYYFMAASTFFITLAGAFVTLRIVEPKLGPYDPSRANATEWDDPAAASAAVMKRLTRVEIRGLIAAFAALLLLAGLLAVMVLPANGVLRNPDTGELLNSPFMLGIVAFIFIGFLVPGFVYGRVVGTMRTDRDLIHGMAGAMSTLGMYLVIVFFAAQFVAWFGWSNLGQILAVKGAGFLEIVGLTGPLVFLGFILVSGFINLMLGSASAQWAVTAPIFVPMLMLIGYSPEVIQAAYRIGDSATNIITPMMSYFGLILAFANRYDRDAGIGTIISLMIPYSVVFMLGWIAFFYLWVFGLGLPVGPGAPTHYPAA